MPNQQSYWEDIGKYWANDNAQFEKTNPDIINRFGRVINPITSFGSSVGSMQNSASQGDILGMILASLGSIPGFGKSTSVSNVLSKQPLLKPNVAKTILHSGIGTGSSILSDYYEPNSN